MVDFNNDTTVATPPGEVVKIVVLERREQVIEALEGHHSVGGEVDTSHKTQVLKARTMAFWYQVQAMVKRRLKDAKGGDDDPTYEEMKEMIADAEGFDQLVVVYEWLNEFVDDMGLTYIDGRPRYDRRNVEEANSKKGM